MFPRAAAVSFLVALVLTAFGVPAAAQDTAASAELIGDSATVVVVDPDGAALDVTHTYTFRNTTDDQAFSGFFETLPDAARDVAAAAAGRSLPVVNIPDGEGFAEWLVSFEAPLNPGQSIDVELTWRLTGLLGDPDEFSRATGDLVSIEPFPVGHRGSASMEVRVPGDWDVIVADDYARTEDEGALVFTVADATAFEYTAMPLVLEGPDRFATSELAAGPVTVTVATADGAATWLGEDLTPLVEDMADWIPLEAPTDVVFRQGFTGGDDLRRADDAIVLPFDASPVVAARAVASAWLESVAFTDDELRDDLGSAIADRVAADRGEFAPPGAGTWSAAMSALVSFSDAATMTTVLTALDGGVPPYGGADDTFAAESIDWRRFTDVAEHLGALDAAADAMRLSADADQVAELDRRDAALVDYRALESRAAPWSMPPLLRDAMAAWDFDAFAADQGAVSDLIFARDEMVVAAAEVDLDIGDHVQQQFEAASSSMDDAWTRFVEQREALDHVAEALRLDTGDRGVLSSLGMAGRDAAGQLDEMRAAWAAGEFDDAAERADHLVEDYESSVGRGTLRLLVPLGVIAVGFEIIRRLRRRARQPQPVEA